MDDDDDGARLFEAGNSMRLRLDEFAGDMEPRLMYVTEETATDRWTNQLIKPYPPRLPFSII